MPPGTKQEVNKFQKPYDDASRLVEQWKQAIAQHPEDRTAITNKMLRGRDLRATDLSYMDLKEVDLSFCDLGEATLVEADLRGAILRSCSFNETNLFNVDLREADLSYSIFFSAEMPYSDLRGANLTGVILGDTNLEGTTIMKDAIKDLDLSMVRHRKDMYIVGENQMVKPVEKKQEEAEYEHFAYCHFCKDSFEEKDIYVDPDNFYCCEECQQEHWPDHRLVRP
jgi:hypothetical protein